MMFDFGKLRVALQGITFSESEVAKMYHIGKAKARRKIEHDFVSMQGASQNSRIKCNAYDVLLPIIEQCINQPIN